MRLAEGTDMSQSRHTRFKILTAVVVVMSIGVLTAIVAFNRGIGASSGRLVGRWLVQQPNSDRIIELRRDGRVVFGSVDEASPASDSQVQSLSLNYEWSMRSGDLVMRPRKGSNVADRVRWVWGSICGKHAIDEGMTRYSIEPISANEMRLTNISSCKTITIKRAAEKAQDGVTSGSS